ncbi:MAG TPA: hypothetical protein VM450_07325 [Thermomicrobiales bacterium]|jgi:hypothetical protein|nr:hypothetical protein [Thermomicrobiales bacterium]
MERRTYPRSKTFLLCTGKEEALPYASTEEDHVFTCYDVGEALRCVAVNALQGFRVRILATPEWERVHGPLWTENAA